MDELGYLIRAYRKKAKIKIEELCERLNLPGRRIIYSWEEDRIIPSLDQIENLAKIFSEKISSEPYEEIRQKLLKAYDKRLKSKIIKDEPEITDLERKSYFKESSERIANNILTDMRKKGIDLYTLSELTGIDQKRISDILIGLQTPTIEEADKIAKALNTPVERYLDPNTENSAVFLITKNPRIKKIVTSIIEFDEDKKEAILEIIEKLIKLHEKE
ncbi:MAG: helix-turn-helix domain-containing protein [Candidatus Aenigmatarchaeota archaeon]|jgi:transcriptional regulator with XRE-family HTH domain